MYKMQICNAHTQEVLREMDYDKPDYIFSLIESAEKNVGQETFIRDNQNRTLKAKYLTYLVMHAGRIIIYKIFFKVAVKASKNS